MITRTFAAICFLATAVSAALADDEPKPLPPCKPPVTDKTTDATATDKTADATANTTQVKAPPDSSLQNPDRRVIMNTAQVSGNPAAMKCKPIPATTAPSP